MCDVLTEPDQFLLAGNSLTELFRTDNLIPMAAITLGCGVAVVSIVMSSIRGIFVARARELTKRELAAYVAEGTLDPDKAVEMLNAGRSHWEVGKGGVSKSGGCCG